MTEAEWLACTHPDPMLKFLRDKASDRKLGLFACACCRRIWHLLPNDRSRGAVEITEDYTDGLVSDEEHAAAGHEVGVHVDEECDAYRAAAHAANHMNVGMAESAAYAAMYAASAAADATASDRLHDAAALDGIHIAYRAERSAQSALVRDIIGNPFHPARIDPSCLRWNDGTIPKIAQGIYEERAFDRLPVLHDALLDADCDDDDILAHCRGAGPHVRGCWVIDLILCKE